MQVMALTVLLAVNRVQEDVWSLKSSLLPGATFSPRWHTNPFKLRGCYGINTPCTAAARTRCHFHLQWDLRGGYLTAQAHNVIPLNSRSGQGIPSRSRQHLPSVQQQLLLPPQLLTQSRVVLSVFQSFLKNLKQEVALGIQTARKRLSPAAQLKYQLLNKVGQEKTVFIRATC